MEYQQLPPPPVPGVLHQAHHQQHQQQPVQPPHPHIVVAPAHQQQPQQPPPPPLPPTSHGHQVHAPLPPIHEDSTSSRWSQYQHLWRQHHVYVNGTRILCFEGVEQVLSSFRFGRRTFATIVTITRFPVSAFEWTALLWLHDANFLVYGLSGFVNFDFQDCKILGYRFLDYTMLVSLAFRLDILESWSLRSLSLTGRQRELRNVERVGRFDALYGSW